MADSGGDERGRPEARPRAGPPRAEPGRAERPAGITAAAPDVGLLGHRPSWTASSASMFTDFWLTSVGQSGRVSALTCSAVIFV